MSARAQSQCTPTCLRYRSFLSPESQAAGIKGPSCEAFPAGIPDEIWTNRFDHRQPHGGDHGLQWSPLPGQTFPEYALATPAATDA